MADTSQAWANDDTGRPHLYFGYVTGRKNVWVRSADDNAPGAWVDVNNTGPGPTNAVDISLAAYQPRPAGVGVQITVLDKAGDVWEHECFSSFSSLNGRLDHCHGWHNFGHPNT